MASSSSHHLNPVLFSLFAQPVLYGIYIATLISCLRWLLFEDEGWELRKKVKWPILTVTLLVWASMTADLAILLSMAIDMLFAQRQMHRDFTFFLSIVRDSA